MSVMFRLKYVVVHLLLGIFTGVTFCYGIMLHASPIRYSVVKITLRMNIIEHLIVEY